MRPARTRRTEATTTKTGGVILQLANLHGDTALQLPADSSAAPTVLDYDEYGNPRTDQPATRYGWLGGKQRSGETPTGLLLMGARLYNPGTGRFLSTDPVPGGSAPKALHVAEGGRGEGSPGRQARWALSVSGSLQEGESRARRLLQQVGRDFPHGALRMVEPGHG
ncbi:RHS repeat-associated core domain-containing protein [Streptomyces misionensis]|uniref:RHS repeat-associated core domain-containing protein n=1 Tax=Streptomyces misionensis TaxID=67331 RepID=UPI00396B5301